MEFSIEPQLKNLIFSYSNFQLMSHTSKDAPSTTTPKSLQHLFSLILSFSLKRRKTETKNSDKLSGIVVCLMGFLCDFLLSLNTSSQILHFLIFPFLAHESYIKRCACKNYPQGPEGFFSHHSELFSKNAKN